MKTGPFVLIVLLLMSSGFSAVVTWGLTRKGGRVMEVKIRQIGHDVGVVLPAALGLTVGDRYELHQMDDTLVLTPVHQGLFANPADWVGFRNHISQEDWEWDRFEN